MFPYRSYWFKACIPVFRSVVLTLFCPGVPLMTDCCWKVWRGCRSSRTPAEGLQFLGNIFSRNSCRFPKFRSFKQVKNIPETVSRMKDLLFSKFTKFYRKITIAYFLFAENSKTAKKIGNPFLLHV